VAALGGAAVGGTMVAAMTERPAARDPRRVLRHPGRRVRPDPHYSPILLALPSATIVEITDDGELEQVEYDDALPVRMTREFLAAPDRLLQHLFSDADSSDELTDVDPTAAAGV
jgi:hypothetical protein